MAHQNLHCLPFLFSILHLHPIYDSGHTQESEIQDGRHDSHLENLFFASSPKPKGQLTPNLLGSIGVTFLSSHYESCSKCLSWWFLGQVWNWVTWGQKLGHLAKSVENLVIILAGTFFKQSSWILLRLFVLMIFRSSSKLGHLGSKTRSPGQIS